MELKDEADPAVAEGDDLASASAVSVAAGDSDAALVGPIQPAEDVQQRALADARGADNRHHLAGVDRQVEVAKHRQHQSCQRCNSSESRAPPEMT